MTAPPGVACDAAYRSHQRLADLRHALGPGPGRRRRQLQHRGLGIPLHRRPLGLRQVDPAQHHRGLSRTLRRRDPHRRQGRHRTRPRPWRGVPGLRPALPVAHGARQRHLRSGDEGDRQGGARGDRARAAQAGEARKIRAVLSAPSVRRDATAGRHRAGARVQSLGAADGRAVRGARRAHPRRHAAAARGCVAGDAQDRGLRDAQCGRGGLPRGSRGGDDGASRHGEDRAADPAGAAARSLERRISRISEIAVAPSRAGGAHTDG